MTTKEVEYIDHIANFGETFDGLALNYYNDEMMASTIIGANIEFADVLIFNGGEALHIPIVEKVDLPETLPPWRRSEE